MNDVRIFMIDLLLISVNVGFKYSFILYFFINCFYDLLFSYFIIFMIRTFLLIYGCFVMIFIGLFYVIELFIILFFTYLELISHIFLLFYCIIMKVISHSFHYFILFSSIITDKK